MVTATINVMIVNYPCNERASLPIWRASIYAVLADGSEANRIAMWVGRPVTPRTLQLNIIAAGIAISLKALDQARGIVAARIV